MRIGYIRSDCKARGCTDNTLTHTKRWHRRRCNHRGIVVNDPLSITTWRGHCSVCKGFNRTKKKSYCPKVVVVSTVVVVFIVLVIVVTVSKPGVIRVS